jgi:hypothetical protein
MAFRSNGGGMVTSYLETLREVAKHPVISQTVKRYSLEMGVVFPDLTDPKGLMQLIESLFSHENSETVRSESGLERVLGLFIDEAKVRAAANEQASMALARTLVLLEVYDGELARLGLDPGEKMDSLITKALLVELMLSAIRKYAFSVKAAHD